MDPILSKHIKFINRFQIASEAFLLLIRLVRSFSLGAVIMGIWASVKPMEQDEQLVIGLMSMSFFFILSLRWNSKTIGADAVLKSLEIKHPEAQRSSFSLKRTHPQNIAWKPYLQSERHEIWQRKLKFLSYKLSTLVIPAVLWLAVTELSPGAMSSAIHSMQKVVAQFTKGTTLTIVKGLTDPSAEDSFKLSAHDSHELTLLEQNRVEVTVVGDENDRPFVMLKPINSAVTQTFRLTSSKVDNHKAGNVHKIAFSIRESAELFVSTLSTNRVAAKVKVLRLPLPQVSLKVSGDKQDPWPDELPLPLEINVSAENPLQLIRLQIESEGQTHTELVSNILAQDKTEVATTYSLLLENYVQQDLATLKITAEALDRHLPNPLMGRSEPLVIKTASAYGRYRETLGTLHNVKQALDKVLSEGSDELDPSIAETMFKAVQQAETSPFFDGLDRHIIRSELNAIERLSRQMDKEELMLTQEKLNKFLFEHETLDDRERDRDFFVAARSLSRLVEQKKADRQIAVTVVGTRLKTFLDERHARWKLRLKYVQEAFKPPEWQQIQNKPFHSMLDSVVRDASTDEEGNQKALQTLSQIVADYRHWIEALEQAEDASREEMEQKRQQGLADSRKQLRELQKRQAKISQKLDRAVQRSQTEIAEQWSSMRMDQNANIKNTKSLEAKLRSLSPVAAERIKAAVQSMGMTIEAGNKEAFVEAESASDLAGRLLRKADSAAKQSQKQKMRRGRRRRVTSDQYYGSSVAGGDVEIRREYEVSRRYREDILDEVRRASQSEGRDRELLENYLRRVIR